MERAIDSFHQDDESHWVASLECGHTLHMRHDPPWQVRQWVVSEDGRRARIGATVVCIACADAAEDAAIRGLCAEGVQEVVNQSRS
jgi:hypothetical protein